MQLPLIDVSQADRCLKTLAEAVSSFMFLNVTVQATENVRPVFGLGLSDLLASNSKMKFTQMLNYFFDSG